MGNNNLQRKYSLRKFKGIGLASAVIGVLFANQSVYANVTSDGKDETTLVKEFDKVPSSAKTTFTDDQNPTKKVTVDAVADIRYNQLTKANQNTGNPDGTDTIKFTTKATVNYLLEDDKSKLQDSKTVEGESGTINTPYDKKGIAYDTDGKDYRESTVEKTGAVNENTGRKVHLEANNKVYELVRSEVINSDKATYEKTKFNDIEAPVSPEGMHNSLGEINYGKITGKVYLVEETSDGHYGKYVEASNINSDEEAVNAWKNGQATAKDFTKENVTLKEGDTVLVMDRDTYAHGSGKRITNTIKYTREKKRVTEFYDKLEEKVVNQQVGLEATYSFYSSTPQSDFSVKVSGEDQIFGTDDDKVV
ncbi:YSIRK-type signal peptide-containing protein [uncultured Granulicatella sp.]|uniref:YSIRK-type signal peptide-containing protein n=1 Tax=uncultured Granulicatella sp. TaxID=316089 RepID=UPI0028D8BD60|nr:YSIRK-type signal peptide-containing protein [uncultured Granulicatella sp.]